MCDFVKYHALLPLTCYKNTGKPLVTVKNHALLTLACYKNTGKPLATLSRIVRF